MHWLSIIITITVKSVSPDLYGTYLGSFGSNGTILLLKYVGILLVVLLDTLYGIINEQKFHEDTILS